MANTRIQIKRATVTTVPPNSSLLTAEPAYSYSSNTFYIGGSDGVGVLPIGGNYYVTQQAALFDVANAAFIKANSAAATGMDYPYVNAVSAASNSWANTVGTAGNNYTISVGASGNNWANTINTAVQTSFAAVNNYSNFVGASSNNWANSVNTYSDSTYFKKTGGMVSGDLQVTGNLNIMGNVTFTNTNSVVVSDPLLYLAGNNYVSDVVDIGIVANYVNATSQNVHTGIFRDSTSKEWYVFEAYDKEPVENQIDTAGNNFTISVLNATVRTSNLILGGANAITTIVNNAAGANGWANTINTAVQTSFAAVNNYSNFVSASSNNWANTINTAIQTQFAAVNNYSNFVGASSNNYANTLNTVIFQTFTNAANLTSGTLDSARLSGSYTGITGVGTITVGTWNGNTINVGYGGTGITTAAVNGVLFGSGGTGALQVTSAGTEGQVLQANATGVPQFGMLDGGTF